MYKKIISILLCLCILSGFVTIASAATPSNADKYEIVEILKTLDMLSEDYDAVTIEWQKPITKAEFAYMAANVLKRDYVGSDELYFHDVSRQHWAFSSISALVESGLLEVGYDKKFNPTEYITLDEAVKIIMKALGYVFDFDSNEHIDFAAIARSCGVTKGVSNVDQLTFSDAINMLYNALITEVVEISGISGGAAVFEGAGKIYLEKEYSISYKKGIVEGFDGISPAGVVVDEGMAMISGVEYEAGNIDLIELMGCSIYYIYNFNDDSDEPGTLLWVSKGKNEELTLNYVDNDVSFNASEYELSYYETGSNRRKKVEISRTVDVIYNNEYVSFGIEELLSMEAYSIKLIKNPGDSGYSKIILSDYENKIIEAIDTNNQVIYDKLSKTQLKLDSFEYVRIVKDNQNVSISDLKVGDVLSVYTSKTGESVTIVVSNNIARGTISAIRTEDGYEYITVGDGEYRWYKQGDGAGALSSIPVSVYLDINGHIAYVEKYVAEGNIAYMIDVRLNGDEYLIVEMLKSDGKIEKINTASTVRIDNVKFKYAESAYGALGERDFKSSLVLYKTDVNGLITHLYFPSQDKNAELKLLQKNASGLYTNAIGRLGRKSIVNDKTIIFSIPKNPKNADYDAFDVFSKSGLVNNKTYTYSSYSLSEEVGYEEILVVDPIATLSDDSGLLVTKKLKALNEYDEVIDVIEGYSGANYVTLKCDPACSAADVEPGMYVIYGVNKNGSVSNLDIKYWYKYGGTQPLNTNINAATTAYTSGYVNKIIGEIVRIGDKSGADFDTIYNFTSSIPVLVYKQNGEVEIGSVASLRAYEAVGEKCSFVFTHIRHGGSKVYIVYE